MGSSSSHVGTPGGPSNDPNTSVHNESNYQRNDGSTFHRANNVDKEDQKQYVANDIANRILKDFGREFSINMDTYMQS